jgi:hypothetical protein
MTATILFDGVAMPAPSGLTPGPTSMGPRYVPVHVARARLEVAGQWDTLVGVLAGDMPRLVKLLTLEVGLDAADPEVRAVLSAIGADPDAILAP